MPPTVIRKPGQDAVAGGGQKVAPPNFLRIAAFGDSLMWGQGLKPEEKFKTLIAAELV